MSFLLPHVIQILSSQESGWLASVCKFLSIEEHWIKDPHGACAIRLMTNPKSSDDLLDQLGKSLEAEGDGIAARVKVQVQLTIQLGPWKNLLK